MRLVAIAVLGLASVLLQTIDAIRYPTSCRSLMVTHAVAPKYPQGAYIGGNEGTVWVKVTFGDDGRVTAIESGPGHPALKEEAEANIRKWRFATPAERGSFTHHIRYRFRIDDEIVSPRPASDVSFVFPDGVYVTAKASGLNVD